MFNIKFFLKNHTLIFIYTIVFGILLNGIFIFSGTKYLFELTLFFVPLLVFYFGFNYILQKKEKSITERLDNLKRHLPKNLDLFLGAFCVILIISHLISLGGSPALQGLSLDESGEVSELRRSITANASVLWGYLSSFNIKAILPFTLLLFLFKKRKILLIVLFVIGAFYAFSLMQKSYILTVLFPIFLYLLLSKKYIQSLGIIATCVFIIFSLVYVSNPQMRGGQDTIPKLEISEEFESTPVQGKQDAPYYIRVIYGLGKRVFVVPGEMVAQWFDAIPKTKPFLRGNGYYFYCTLTGNEYHEYSKELYPIIRPNYAEKGLKGSVNTASFMYEYSNFGRLGMVLSALFFSIVLIFTEFVFKHNLKMKIALNLFPVFMLSSGALTTALFSGGWGLIIFLYFLFSKEFKS